MALAAIGEVLADLIGTTLGRGDPEPVAKSGLDVDVEPPQVGKQAVVIVHGMGEQRPMDTVRTFVQTMWEKDVDVAAGSGPGRTDVWSRRDVRTGSLELQRITTRVSKKGGSFPEGARTDFYELYWADLTAGSTWDQFANWLWYLLFRRWRNVPGNVRSAWLLLWLITLALALISLATALPEATWAAYAPKWLPRWTVLAIVGAASALIAKFATRSFGRVVRYTRAEPDNIAARAAVRERGFELLEALHAGREYDRVIVVGHSLGTMLAYDLICYFWARRDASRAIHINTPEFGALKALEQAAANLENCRVDDKDPQAIEPIMTHYRARQSDLRRLLAKRPTMPALPGVLAPDDGRWLISDFLTIGSPLTHAEFLLTSTVSDFDKRKREREFPTAPPYRETLDDRTRGEAERAGLLDPEAADKKLFSFSPKSQPGIWTMHQAAPFAVVRWSNVHDPARFVVCGDLISGPLSQHFGRGVVDVDLRALRGQSMWFSHTRYWSLRAPARQLETLRTLLNLLDK